MLQGRRLCKISLLLIIIIAFSVYGPWDFLGVYAKANAASACLSDGMVVQATGYVYHKEIKNDDVVYYVKNATLNCEKGRLNQTSFIFKFDSDNIPNYCKLNIEGTVSSFMEARNEGGFDGKNYYQSMGLYFQLKDVKVLECKSFLLGGEDLLYRLRQSISNVYKWALPGEEAGFLSSITIGNKGDLLGDLKTLFQLVGVAHVLAVSGLHVSVICMAMYRGFRKRGISFLTSGIVGGIVAVLYGVLTGGSVSSVRAIGMFLVFILADILGESYDSLTALFFLADILIFINPLYLKNGSFIFSFSAIFGILFVSLPLNRMYMEYCNGRQKLIKSDDGFGHVIKKSWKRRLVEWFCSSLIFSIGIYVSMLPLVSYMYYETPVYSVFLNLFVLPLMPILLCLGLAGGFIGLIILPFSKVFLVPCHFVIYLFEMLAGTFAKIPNANVIVGRPSFIKILLFYLGLFIAVKWQDIYKFRVQMINVNPGKKNYLIKRKLALSLGIVVFVGILWFVPSKNGFEVDVLDVGQGDGIYISSGDGSRFFIDGGSTTLDSVGQYTILPYLKYKGARQIDYWFVSHTDEDHISGLIYVLEYGYKVDHLVISSEMLNGDALERLVTLAKASGTEVIYMKNGDVCGTKHLKFKCVYPYVGATSDDVNELCLALLMEYDRNLDGKADFTGFFGGDLGAAQEQYIAASGSVNHVDLLKVSHHGSRFSSDSTFLKQLSPDIAVISCAKRNRYGHPAQEAVERLEATCDQILYTMDSGRIQITLAGAGGYL